MDPKSLKRALVFTSKPVGTALNCHSLCWLQLQHHHGTEQTIFANWQGTSRQERAIGSFLRCRALASLATCNVFVPKLGEPEIHASAKGKMMGNQRICGIYVQTKPSLSSSTSAVSSPPQHADQNRSELRWQRRVFRPKRLA